MHTYQKIEKAIQFLLEAHEQQPKLETVAEKACLSPYHFQKVFQEWAGVSPKKFLQFVSLQHAKEKLATAHNLETAADSIGLSGSSRLHDLFVNIEGMTPGAYKAGGKHIPIDYETFESPFGPYLIGSTPKGVCHLAFYSDWTSAELQLKSRWPNATFHRRTDHFHEQVHAFFEQKTNNFSGPIHLHLRATPFQLKVWEALLKIPQASLTSYSQLAEMIGHPKAGRAVGSAVGKNPVAYLIPCHRVILKSGILGNYRWGSHLKATMIGWESAQDYVGALLSPQ